MPDDRATTDRLVRYWDAFLRHGRADPAGVDADLDPDVVLAIQRVHTLAAVPPPGSRERVWRSVQRDAGRRLTAGLAPAPSLAAEPLVFPVPAPGATGTPERGAWRGRWVGTIATAALLLLTLFGSLLVIGSGRLTRQHAIPTILPAVVATPEARPTGAIAEFVWETRGNPDSPLGLPGPLAVDAEGNLWITDSLHHQFQIVSPEGAYLETWGEPGSGEGQFNFENDFYPGGAVAFAPDGSFYVVDTGNRRVQRFGPDRSFIGAWGGEGAGPGQFIWPTSIAVDDQGRVYVTDDKRSDVQVFAPDGSYLRTIGEHGFQEGQLLLASGGSVSVAADGTVWVGDRTNHRIQGFSPEGKLRAVLSKGPDGRKLGQPGQMAVDRTGRLFVIDSEADQMQVFAPDGGFLAAFGKVDPDAWSKSDPDPMSFQYPTGLALDGRGNVYISDHERGRVAKFRLLPPFAAEAAPQSAPSDDPAAPIAELVWETRGGPDLPLGLPGQLALDPDGNLWVPDSTHDRFQVFSPDGAFIEAWGRSGAGEGDFEFDSGMYPGGAIAFAPDGAFYVVDPGNRRVQKFASDRSFVSAWGGEGTGPGQFKWPAQIALDRQGRVYVTDDGRNDVQVFTADGEYLRTIGERGFGEGQFLFTSGSGVSVSGDGRIWVSDGTNHRIQVFSPEGDLLEVLSKGPAGDELGEPHQVGVDATGRLMVAIGDLQQMQVFAPDGAFLGALGSWDAGAWGELDPDPHTFLYPTGLVLDGEGNVYISDAERERIAKFRLLPPFAP
jgi:DNA-binding beta-propeller fold protein YncE